MENYIVDLYAILGISPCAIKLLDIRTVYEMILKECRLELVIFSTLHNDAIVFDSPLDSDSTMTRSKNRVVFLWLNLFSTLESSIWVAHNSSRFDCVFVWKGKGVIPTM